MTLPGEQSLVAQARLQRPGRVRRDYYRTTPRLLPDYAETTTGPGRIGASTFDRLITLPLRKEWLAHESDGETSSAGSFMSTSAVRHDSYQDLGARQRHPWADVNEVDGPIAEDLIGDVEPVRAPRVAVLGDLHEPILGPCGCRAATGLQVPEGVLHLGRMINGGGEDVIRSRSFPWREAASSCREQAMFGRWRGRR
jgi:hypothetical protein